jgi:peptide/nickel transport system ATP-binding protein
MTARPLVLQARSLSVSGPSGVIVEPLDLDVVAGRTLAIVGESGSGKSLTARALCGLLDPTLTATGTVRLGDHELDLAASIEWTALRGSAISLLLQDPFTSLSPVHRCGAQIGLTVRTAARRAGRRLTRAQVAEAVAERLTEVGLDASVARRYPHELSGGMRQRVAIAAAIAGDPDVLIADEPTTALDASTQGEVLAVIAELQARRGLGVILISHDLGVVRGCADDVVVLYAGAAVERGTAAAVFDSPVHPYTAGLLAAEPPLDRRLNQLVGIPGSVPAPGQRGDGCAFAARCALATDVCRREPPALALASTGSLVACHHSSSPIAVAQRLSSDERPHLLVREPVLQARAVRAWHGTTDVLHGVDLDVAAGEIVGVVGESGSGKTTLARCMVGLHTEHDGEVRLGGEPLPRGLAGRDPRAMQIIFQDPYSALNPRLTIGATLREALAVGGRRADEVTGLLESVGLPAHYAGRRPRDLSGGERQRVAIARALAPRPRLLICDESVSALDVSVQAQILDLLRGIRAELGTPMLFITHDLAVVRQLCDRVLVLRHGEVVEVGQVEQVFDAPVHPYTRSLLAASAPVPDAKGRTTP